MSWSRILDREQVEKWRQYNEMQKLSRRNKSWSRTVER